MLEAARTDDLDSLWEQLRGTAREVAARAHAPHSGFQVGAAGLCEDGQVVVGCNVENATYTGLHAEWGVVGAAVAGGHGKLLAIAIQAVTGGTVLPCGACRQILLDHSGAELLVDEAGQPLRLEVLLPGAFTSEKLPARE